MDRFVRQHDFEVTMGKFTAFAPGAMGSFSRRPPPSPHAPRDTKVDELFQQWRTGRSTAHAQATERLQDTWPRSSIWLASPTRRFFMAYGKASGVYVRR